MNPDNAALTPLLHEATELLKALSHPARLMICCELRDKELSVSEIEKTLKIRQPRLSRELAKLRELGLVTTRRRSKSVFYTISKESRAKQMVDAICSVMLVGMDELTLNAPNHIEPCDQSVVLSRQQECGVFARVQKA